MIPFRGWNRAAPWLGAVAGFSVGVVLSRTISLAAKPGQLPGIAATIGFDPHGYLWRLVILVVCPIVGGFLATWLAKAAPPPDEAEIPQGRAGFLRSMTVGILLAGSVTALSAAAHLRRSPVVTLYEDGHGLLPASEYRRGELPYRDIIPGHGLVADGLLQAAGLAAFGDDYRGWHRSVLVVGLIFWPSLYALAYVATGSHSAAFAALLLSFFTFPQHGILRPLPSLWILALAIRASRTGRERLWLACGILIPLALLVAVEFAAYAAGAALVALWVARGKRLRHLRSFVAGAAASSVAIALAFAARGILSGFVESTFFYLPTLLPAYAIAPVPPAFPWSPGFPTLIAYFADPAMFLYYFATLAVLVLGAVLPLGARIGDRARSALPILAWVVFAMVSAVERQHVRYPTFLVPLGLVLLALWLKGPRPWTSRRGLVAAAALLCALLLRKPWSVARGLAHTLSTGGATPDLATFDRPARARGALFPQADAALVRATSALIEKANFSPADTWLDFANASGLHYLFDRDCPIRYYEVPFYESEAAQDEVIAAIERNPRVRAVLVKSGLPTYPLDGVPSAARAPKVEQFLELNFQPFLKEDGVEWWLRRSSP